MTVRKGTFPSRRTPHGGEGMLLVTTYDLDDDAFTAAEERWNAWWEQLPR